ncbi:MAG: hypothetical protein VX874_20970 [Pseudomonadota bacterium]|nr:hypothetical protein [Pseudomonadota bacterium]
MNSLTKVPAGAPTDQSFRVTLRSATRAEHDASEIAFAPFMDDPARHVAPFLAAQHAALTAVSNACATEEVPEIAGILPDLIERLSADCADLGVVPPAVDHEGALSGLASAYLVLGSQMGVAAMRKRADEVGLDPMPRFFTPVERRSAWASVCTKLGRIGPDSAEATRMIDDTRAGYALYARAGALAFGKPAA